MDADARAVGGEDRHAAAPRPATSRETSRCWTEASNGGFAGICGRRSVQARMSRRSAATSPPTFGRCCPQSTCRRLSCRMLTARRVTSPEAGRYLRDHIPGAKLVELAGNDQHHWYWGSDSIAASVGTFLADVRDEEAEFDRVLATVLFTDIVGSTEKAAELGDRRWRELVHAHHASVRALLARYRGKEVDTAGDGFFATFDGPVRALRCAKAIVDSVEPLGIEVRAGLHTGECEVIDNKVGGLAVNIGARICGLARPSEILASQTMKDLVAGAGLRFDDRGAHH